VTADPARGEIIIRQSGADEKEGAKTFTFDSTFGPECVTYAACKLSRHVPEAIQSCPLLPMCRVTQREVYDRVAAPIVRE
jgi:hypothetical protein